MSGGDARVGVLLEGVDHLSGPLGQGQRQLRAFGAAGTVASGGFNVIGRTARGASGALSHFGGAMKGLITGPLGLIGLGGVALTVGGIFEKSVGKAQDFGKQVYLLGKLTNTAAPQMSALLAVMEKFGVDGDAAARALGFLEKNVGLLAAKKDGIVKFQKEFGFAILGTNGHIKDANQLILTAADYFTNKHIPATEKAAAMSKLFGRGWQQMIPVLALGSKGIRDAEQAAKDLGMTLTETNAKDLAKFRQSTRELNEAVSGLELQIGLALVPALTELANAAGKFISDPENRSNVLGFVKGALTAAQGFAAFVTGTLIPTVHTIGSAAVGAWHTIPAPLRDLMVKGFVANKAVKFAFGIDIAGDVGKLLTGTFLSRGSSAANPMWVQSVGGIKGGDGGAGLAGAAAAIAAGAAAAVAILVGAKVLTDVINPANQPGSPEWQNFQNNYRRPGNPNGGSPTYKPSGISGGASEDLRALRDAITAQTSQEDASHLRLAENSRALSGNTAALHEHAQRLEHWAGGMAGVRARSIARFGGQGLGDAAVHATFERDLLRETKSILKSHESTAQKIADLKVIAKQGDPATRRVLSEDIRKLKMHVSVKTSISIKDVITGIGAHAAATVSPTFTAQFDS